jgi:formate-dependent nitrite reductase membrane component NrfD
MERQVIQWGMPIIIYIFLGGLAGGAYLIAALADLCDLEEKKTIAKIGFSVALPAIIIGGLCLIGDLGRPERFYNVLRIYKFTSPMSVGVWGVITFSVFSIISFLMIHGMDENSSGIWRLGYYISLVVPRKAINAIGLSVAVFLAGYTGVLLTETSRPFWSDTPFLGALFIASGVSSAIAFIYFFYDLKKSDENGNVELSKYKLKLVDNMAIFAELVIILFMLVELANENRLVLMSKVSGMFWIGVVLIGLVIPLILNFYSMINFRIRGKKLSKSIITPILIIVGGFLLRYVVVIAGQI